MYFHHECILPAALSMRFLGFSLGFLDTRKRWSSSFIDQGGGVAGGEWNGDMILLGVGNIPKHSSGQIQDVSKTWKNRIFFEDSRVFHFLCHLHCYLF